jgi:HAD superfamily hydrolase (TIGR01549 family)
VRSGPGSSVGPVEAVLLDMDDTIFDHSLTCRAAIAALRAGRPFLRARPLDELWREYLRLLDAVVPPGGQGSLTPDEARRERWRRLALGCGEELAPPEVAELSRAYRESYQKLRRAVPGARRLLERLHGVVPVVVVTNNEVAEQEEKVHFLGIGALLDGLIVSEAVGASKPDRRIFEAALAAAGVPAARATMLGDSWTSDVLGARAAGVRPVWFNRFSAPRPAATGVAELRSLRPVGAAERLLLGEAPSGPPEASGPAPTAL